MSPTKRRGLDPKTLATLPPGDHNDGAGLVLRVFPTGARAWMLRYRPKAGTKRGPQRRLRLGELGGPLALDVSALRLGEGFQAPGELGVAAARVVAKALSGLAASGVDPMELLTVADRSRRAREDEAAKRQAEGTLTVGSLLDRFLAAREDVRPNTRKLWESLTRAALKPAFGDRDPRDLTRAEVKSWHRATGETGRKTWANRAVELLKGAYSWAVEDELLPSSPSPATSVASLGPEGSPPATPTTRTAACAPPPTATATPFRLGPHRARRARRMTLGPAAGALPRQAAAARHSLMEGIRR